MHVFVKEIIEMMMDKNTKLNEEEPCASYRPLELAAMNLDEFKNEKIVIIISLIEQGAEINFITKINKKPFSELLEQLYLT